MKRKVLATALAATMVIGSLTMTGCGSEKKKKTPEVKELFAANEELAENLAKGEEQIKITTSGAIELKSTAVKAAYDEASSKLSASFEGLFEMDGKDNYHGEVKYDYDFFGMSKDSAEMAFYLTKDGEAYATMNNEDWYVAEVDMDDFRDDLDESVDEAKDNVDDEYKDFIKDLQEAVDDNDNVTLKNKKGEWILEAKVDLSDIDEDQIDELEDNELLEDYFDKLDLSADDFKDLKGTMTATVKFDEKTQYLTYVGVEFDDDFLDSVADLAGAYVDSISKLEFEMTIEYKTDEIEVPSKVKKNAEKVTNIKEAFIQKDSIGGGLIGGGDGVIIGGGDDGNGNGSGTGTGDGTGSGTGSGTGNGGSGSGAVGDNDYTVTVNGHTLVVSLPAGWEANEDIEGYFSKTDYLNYQSVVVDDLYLGPDYYTFDVFKKSMAELIEGTPVETKIGGYSAYFVAEDGEAIAYLDMNLGHMVQIMYFSGSSVTPTTNDIETILGWITVE